MYTLETWKQTTMKKLNWCFLEWGMIDLWENIRF
jgi:hypothetical protein